MKDINWSEIQEYYNDKHTWDDISQNYHISMIDIANAKKQGLFMSRTKSEANKLSCAKYPRKLAQKTKDKISISRIKYLKEHPDQVPYLLNHYSKGESYPEKYFNGILEKSNINYERYVQYGIYNLDFAIIDKLIDLEIDGNQHICDKSIVMSNNRRDVFLKENGWRVIRVLWSDYCKLNKEERENFIIELLSTIENDTIKQENLELILLSSGLRKIVKHKYCLCGNKINMRSNSCNLCSRKPIIDKPDYLKLISDINTLGYKASAKKYCTSYSSIHRWKREYEAIE